MSSTTLKSLFLRVSFWPSFDDDERTQHARTFPGVALSTLAVIVAFLSLLIALQPGTFVRRAGTLAMVIALFGALLWFNQRGFVRGASWLLVLGLAAIVAQRSYSSGSTHRRCVCSSIRAWSRA